MREAKFEKGSHWVDEQKFGGRAYFQAAARPAAALVIDNTTNNDNGLYRCRVDFHKSPTRNARVQLRVIGEWPWREGESLIVFPQVRRHV